MAIAHDTGSRRPRRSSDPWLWAAVVATVIAFVVGWSLVRLMGPVMDPAEPILADGSADASEADALVVVVARTPGGASEWRSFTRVIGVLSDEIGRPVTVRYVAREDEAGAIIRAEGADIAFLCAHMYLDLQTAGIVEGVAVPVIDGQSDCAMQLVVRPDDPADSFMDLADRAVAVSDKSSLGGQAYLIWECERNGVALPGFFSEVHTGETMGENIQALLAAQVDATVVNSVQISGADAERTRVIESSPRFGLPPVTVAADMDDDLKADIIRALLAFDSAEHLAPDSSIDGFVSISEVDYSFEAVLARQCGDHGHVK